MSYIYLVEWFGLIHTHTLLNVTRDSIIAERVYELANFQPTHMRDQMS